MGSVEKRKRRIDVERLRPPLLTQQDREDFAAGIVLFNSGRFWESHEAWESVWQRHTGDDRIFFQGLIQVAAAMHQLQRYIYHGADKHFRNALWKLKPFAPTCLGIDVAGLVAAIETGHAELQRLGRANIAAVQQSLVIKIKQND